MAMHRALERQIKRYLGDISTSSQWKVFLDAVSMTYTHFDEDRNLLDHSLELSSKEFTELNKQLAGEKEIIERKVKERTAELDYERKKLYEITQNMATGAILLDSAGRVMFVNKVAEEILDCSNLDQNQVVDKFYKSFASMPIARRLEKCLKGEQSEIPEVEYRDRTFQILFRCIFSDNLAKEHLIWIQDITKAKLLERSKKEFVAIASHEMRTPLAIIRGHTELLLNTPVIKSAPDDIITRLTSINKNSVRLLHIVNDFLDLTWLEEKKANFKKTNFGIISLIKEVISDLEKIAEQKGLSLVFDELKNSLPEVRADRERTHQILTNLVANALQYTDRGEVTILTLKEGASFLKILVKDTGMGIEPAKQPFLFQKFQMTGKTFMKSQEYGSGMGLYITKLLVEQMGGKIKLEDSSVGKGSAFSFTLPVADENLS